MQNSMTQVVDPTRARKFFEDKISFTTGPVELDHLLKADRDRVTVIDVREAEDYAKGHIPGAINLPKGTWESSNELTKDRTNVMYCYTQTCHLAANACLLFASRGFPVVELEGGFETWKENDLDIEHESTNRLKRTSEVHGKR